jgi:hypothetical protein
MHPTRAQPFPDGECRHSQHPQGELPANPLGQDDRRLRGTNRIILKQGSRQIHWVWMIEDRRGRIYAGQESNPYHEHLLLLAYSDAGDVRTIWAPYKKCAHGR